MPNKLMLVIVLLVLSCAPLFAAPSEVPRDVSGSAQINVDENSTFVANFIIDDEFEGTKTLSLEGEDGDLFDLNSGQLTFSQPPNFEQPGDNSHNNVYTLRVNARDSQGNPSAIDIQIIVINVNEAPEISINSNYSAYEDTSFSFQLAASDEDGDEFAFSLSGTDAELFLLSEDFLVTPIFTLNFEQPQDQDANNEYDLIVLAEDINGNIGQLQVNFSVLNRPELGYFTGLAPIIIYEVDASNGESSPLFTTLTWVEPDAQFAGQVLTIWGHLTEDSIVLESDAEAGLTVLSQSGQVIYMDNIVAQITQSKNGEAGTPLEITFNEFTTPDAANLILSAISYRNSTILPTESRLIYFELVDENDKVIRLINSLDMAEATEFQPSFKLTSDTNTHLTDINNDNLIDLVTGSSDGQLAVYLNNDDGSLDWQSTANGTLAQFDVGSDAVPVAADLDNDGDNDLLVGNQSGFLSYFENTTDGGALTFVSKIGRDNPGRFIDVGEGARPTLVDVDNDLDFDLYITNSDGELYYYQNIGSVSNAVFELQSQTLIDLSLVGNILGLTFADIDTDGDDDLLVGSDSGRLIYYKSLGTVTQPLFKSEGLVNPFSQWQFESYVFPHFVDVDGDQDLDLLVQSSASYFDVFNNQSGLTVNVVKRNNTVPTFALPDEVNLVSNVTYVLTAEVTDAEDDPMTFQWQQLSGPDAVILRQLGQELEFVAPSVEQHQILQFKLVASDGRSSAEQLYNINVFPIGTNIPGYNLPTIELGETLTAAPGEQVWLAGVIFDADDDELVFNWIQATGPSVELIDADTLTPNFIAPTSEDSVLLKFRLVVNDGQFTVYKDISVVVDVIAETPDDEIPDEAETEKRSSAKFGLSLSTTCLFFSIGLLGYRRRWLTKDSGSRR